MQHCSDFKQAACCPSAVVQGAARRKNGLCGRIARGNWDPREGQQPFWPNANGAGDCTTTLRLLIGAVHFASFMCCIYDRNFALHYSERLESIVFWGRTEGLHWSLEFNSKSELVEDREGKSVLYCCNLLL